MTEIFLIHGAWHGAWAWEKLIPVLEARGFTVHAPDLPGHGNGFDLTQQTLENYRDHIVALLDQVSSPAVLVGHSMSGAILSMVAEKCPEKIHRLVYVSAYLVPNGQSLATLMQKDTESEAAKFSKKLPDAAAVLMSEDGLRTAVYNGCDAEDINAAIIRVHPQAITTFTTEIHVTDEKFGTVPRAYVECGRDKAISIDMQRQMQTTIPCFPVFTLNAGHVPQTEMPEDLADAIETLTDLPRDS